MVSTRTSSFRRHRLRFPLADATSHVQAIMYGEWTSLSSTSRTMLAELPCASEDHHAVGQEACHGGVAAKSAAVRMSTACL